MLLPVVTLALLATFVGFLNVDFAGFAPITIFTTFLKPVLGVPAHQASNGIAGLALLAGVCMSLLGVGIVWLVYGKGVISRELIPTRLPWVYRYSFNRCYWDEIYDVTLIQPTLAVARVCRRVLEPELIDGAITAVKDSVATLAADFRSFQTGFLKDYALIFFLFAVVGLLVMGLRLT
jgi:NADH:ubiquinone oxidoreductase subunit 5 (subunit L)/multisubunit Na+/H+ antiporter MnhA subunit